VDAGPIARYGRRGFFARLLVGHPSVSS